MEILGFNHRRDERILVGDNIPSSLGEEIFIDSVKIPMPRPPLSLD